MQEVWRAAWRSLDDLLAHDALPAAAAATTRASAELVEGAPQLRHQNRMWHRATPVKPPEIAAAPAPPRRQAHARTEKSRAFPSAR
jgi:hypothetical protein